MKLKGVAICLGLLLIFCLVAMTTGAALAQEQARWPDTPQSVKFEFRAGLVGSAKVDGRQAELGYSSYKVAAKFKGFNTGYELRNFRWSDNQQLPFSSGGEDPFDNMHTIWLGYDHHWTVNPRWGWRAFTRLSSSFEEEVFGLPTLFFGAGVDFTLPSKVVLTGGVIAGLNDAEQYLMPFAGVLYRPGAVDGFSGSLGFPYSNMAYHFSPKMSLVLNSGYTRRTYKLADDNQARPDGEFRLREFSLGLGLNYGITGRWQLAVGAEFLYFREITFFDQGGESGDEYDLDSTWGLYGKLVYAF